MADAHETNTTDQDSGPGTDGAASAPQYAPECYACPIGTASMAVRALRPDATAHLVRAGREAISALRLLLDTASELLSGLEQGPPPAAEPPAQDIGVRRR